MNLAAIIEVVEQVNDSHGAYAHSPIRLSLASNVGEEVLLIEYFSRRTNPRFRYKLRMLQDIAQQRYEMEAYAEKLVSLIKPLSNSAVSDVIKIHKNTIKLCEYILEEFSPPEFTAEDIAREKDKVIEPWGNFDVGLKIIQVPGSKYIFDPLVRQEKSELFLKTLEIVFPLALETLLGLTTYRRFEKYYDEAYQLASNYVQEKGQTITRPGSP